MALTPAQTDACLKRLLALPANARCADCPERRPKWASINLGVFVCLRCSGCHRGLGVHVSMVRSVTLDTWNRADLERLGAVGNGRGNAEWMALAPPGLALPTRDATMEELKAFVTRKYARKEWYAPALPPREPAAVSGAGGFSGSDPFANGAVALAAAGPAGFAADPFGAEPFDGSSPPPTRPVSARTGGALSPPALEDPFGGASPAAAPTLSATAAFSSADPFGEAAAATGNAPPAWTVSPPRLPLTTAGAFPRRIIPVAFRVREPLGLGLAARASFAPSGGNFTTCS